MRRRRQSRLDSTVDVSEEHLKHGVQVLDPPIATWLIGLLLSEQTAHQRGEDVDVGWAGDARGDQQVGIERQELLCECVRRRAGFESRNGPLEQQLTRGWILTDEVPKSQAPVPHRLPRVTGIGPGLRVSEQGPASLGEHRIVEGRLGIDVGVQEGSRNPTCRATAQRDTGQTLPVGDAPRSRKNVFEPGCSAPRPRICRR